MKNKHYFIIGCLLVLIILFATAFVVYAAISVNVCHATGSAKNPYNLVVVSVNSVDDANGLNGHGDHINDAWQSYVFDGVTYPGQNESLFGTVITADCSPFVPEPSPTFTLPPTETQVPPTPTNTPTDPPTATSTPEPTATGTLVPTNTPVPTSISTAEPTATSVPLPTDTPFPPQPAEANSTVDYPGDYLGTMIISTTEFPLYQGANATDGSLLLPSYHKGAALYQGTVWVHRLWATGWIDIEIGDTVIIQNQPYKVASTSFIDYGIYPPQSESITYIATCYSDSAGKWVGVELYKLIK